MLLGAGIFIFLGLVLPDLEDEEEDDSDTAQGADSPTGSKSNPVYGVSETTRLLTDSSSDAEEGRATPSMNTAEKTQDPPTFVDTTSSKSASLTLPWVRLAAVGLDGAVDGMLLGIVSSVGDKEAMLIAVGMTIDMCFVGVTLSMRAYFSPRQILDAQLDPGRHPGPNHLRTNADPNPGANHRANWHTDHARPNWRPDSVRTHSDADGTNTGSD